MQTSLRKLPSRRFINFVLVGLASLAVEYVLLFILLSGLGVNYLLATSTSFIVSIIVNYFLSMRFVFEHRDELSRRREFSIFTVLSVISLTMNDACMFVGVSILQVDTMLAKLISTFIVTWYNYLSRRHFLDAN